ncbi:hypothetical protein L596_020012 [Steinernema carpocapsae]|uniref:F-box domain-containing protein n=1 Tax=Steinernema carpocapsae TaxID=34508 RepID=A0A4U5MSB2_STECR|nr:hypothetical protein L596_020012 [Steinernema carpocapsae]
MEVLPYSFYNSVVSTLPVESLPPIELLSHSTIANFANLYRLNRRSLIFTLTKQSETGEFQWTLKDTKDDDNLKPLMFRELDFQFDRIDHVRIYGKEDPELETTHVAFDKLPHLLKNVFCYTQHKLCCFCCELDEPSKIIADLGLIRQCDSVALTHLGPDSVRLLNQVPLLAVRKLDLMDFTSVTAPKILETVKNSEKLQSLMMFSPKMVLSVELIRIIVSRFVLDPNFVCKIKAKIQISLKVLRLFLVHPGWQAKSNDQSSQIRYYKQSKDNVLLIRVNKGRIYMISSKFERLESFEEELLRLM